MFRAFLRWLSNLPSWQRIGTATLGLLLGAFIFVKGYGRSERCDAGPGTMTTHPASMVVTSCTRSEWIAWWYYPSQVLALVLFLAALLLVVHAAWDARRRGSKRQARRARNRA